jgi:hypothetical protein
VALLETILPQPKMKKTKKKKGGKQKKATVLGATGKSLRKLGKGTATKLGKLSTTQKVLAGTALGVLGVRYLVKKLGKPKPGAETDDTTNAGIAIDASGAEANLTALEE